jgi:hypothetical protein
MVTKFDIFQNYNLFNHAGLEHTVFYNPSTQTFVARPVNARTLKQLVQTPYANSFQRDVWKEFWDLLDPEARIIAKSFPEKRGFFQYMNESGLIGQYDAAYAIAAEKAIENWEQDNELVINWTSILCDW